ncbi:hypothetical protein ES703_70278 [subsurface metagenome]
MAYSVSKGSGFTTAGTGNNQKGTISVCYRFTLLQVQFVQPNLFICGHGGCSFSGMDFPPQLRFQSNIRRIWLAFDTALSS